MEVRVIGREMVLSFEAPVLVVFVPHVSVVFGIAVFEGCQAGDDVEVDRNMDVRVRFHRPFGMKVTRVIRGLPDIDISVVEEVIGDIERKPGRSM